MSAPIFVQRKPVRVQYIRPVYTQVLNVANELCELCQKSLQERCNKCVTANIPHCELSIGKCHHAFHKHCLADWNKPTCPIDLGTWVVESK